MTFNLHIGIDYSGAETAESRLKGLQVYATTEGPPQRVIAVPEEGKTHWNWSRARIAGYLIELAETDTPFIAGIDHAFSFPQRHFEEHHLRDWDAFLSDFVAHWPTHQTGVSVESLREVNWDNTGKPDELRTCDRWTSSAKSVFKFGVPGQVATSTHAGIPWLWHIRNEVGDRVHFWPFDGWAIPEGMSVIAETYPSIFRNRYPDHRLSGHEHDAYSVARWLAETCENGFLDRYLDPPLTEREREVAMLEGWILGIA